ncbi:MAG: metalloregulator ArsR/SmtB family transcription factor [Kiritimatiellae bacterium]|nr:metalloregulator ArsR/SmtB family transcription factor [Kiritimatiellia bacterium]
MNNRREWSCGGLPAATLEQVADLLRVIAHPVRLKLLELLRDRRGASVGELARAVGESPAATSQHLNQLRRAGALSAVRDGRRVRYRIGDERIQKLVRCVCCAGAAGAKGGAG